MSSPGLAVSALEYREAGATARAGLHLVAAEEGSVDESTAVVQMQRDMEEAHQASMAEVESRMRREVEVERDRMMGQFSGALEKFDAERSRYFAALEQEVVRLALGIARKILQREAELDPTLLGALVRIALERMEAGSEVRMRVPPQEVERWRAMSGTDRTSWDVVGDATLAAGDCVVETALGKANFGFEAQLADVEQTFRQLLAQRPEAA